MATGFSIVLSQFEKKIFVLCSVTSIRQCQC